MLPKKLAKEWSILNSAKCGAIAGTVSAALLSVCLFLAGCAQQPLSPLSEKLIPANLKPIILDSQDSEEGIHVEVVNVRIQPAARRDFTLRLKQLVTTGGGRVPSDTTYKGFTIITSREDGRTALSTYVEQISGSIYPLDLANDMKQAAPISVAEQPYLVVETVHNADNSIYMIEFPFLIDLLLNPEVRSSSPQVRERLGLRFFALQYFMENFWVIMPIRTASLQIGRSIWPASMLEINRLWTSELVPAIARSSTFRKVYDLSPPAERAKFGNPKNYEEFSQVLAQALTGAVSALFSGNGSSLSMPVIGAGLWEGQDVLQARGPFRFQVGIGPGGGSAQVRIVGTNDVLIDPYSGQTVRTEYAAVMEAVGPKGSVIVEQNISATTAPPPNARRVVSPPVLGVVVPPSQPTLPRLDSGQSTGRDFGDLPVGGTARRISDIYRNSVGAIFTVVAGNSQGSGFAVDATHVLTNRHVVEGATSGVRLMQNGALVTTASVEKVFSGETDLAILRLDKPISIHPLELAEELPQIGTEILIIGSPIGLDGSVTGGMVSQLRFFGDAGYLQIDALINPGNSGGPVLDRLGRVVGIATSRLVGPNQIRGIGFALGAETIRRAITGTVQTSSNDKVLFGRALSR